MHPYFPCLYAHAELDPHGVSFILNLVPHDGRAHHGSISDIAHKHIKNSSPLPDVMTSGVGFALTGHLPQ